VCRIHQYVCPACPAGETVKYFTNEQLEEHKYSEAIDGYQVHQHPSTTGSCAWVLARVARFSFGCAYSQ